VAETAVLTVTSEVKLKTNNKCISEIKQLLRAQMHGELLVVVSNQRIHITIAYTNSVSRQNVYKIITAIQILWLN